MTISQWLLALVPVVCSLFAVRGILHYFQLESYQFPGYFRTLSRNKMHGWLPGVLTSLGCMALFYAFDVLGLREGGQGWKLFIQILVLPLAAGFGWLISRLLNESKAKKPFVFTGRVKRLYCVLLLVMLGLSLWLAQSPLAVLPCLWPLALPLVVALAGLLAWPIEKLISEMYFRDARRKLLSNPRLIRIGITGSYGKTSVKHILGTLLSEKYPTLITPASFNTPMGVSRAIREKLTPSYQVFVGEMGARHVGDIREMCRLVKPTIGILTSVGPQHLDTFKTVQRVAKTKFELMEALPQDGHGYFFDDGAICKELYDKMEKPKTLVSLMPGQGDCWCEKIEVSPSGCSFDLHLKGKGSVSCRTLLLGEHNIQNILLAAAVASDLGLSLKQIAHGISQLMPVKNRLELIAHAGSFTIINDAFNSNPVGAKAALKVLASFPQRRIIITPGMVELGEQEAEYNREFGRAIAQSADIAIVIGKKRAVPILQGLAQGGFPPENIHQVASLNESTSVLHSLVRPTDTVLYENDLPDNYQEA